MMDSLHRVAILGLGLALVPGFRGLKVLYLLFVFFWGSY